MHCHTIEQMRFYEKINLDRYDDRDDIRTNLIESYERLTQFIAKHLNDPFYLEGDTRISLRNKIFREAIANILIHREYSNAYTAKMIIQKDKVIFENANKANRYGIIDPNNFTPFTKNPAIAKVFREIGYAEELGSGIKNLFKYSKLYGGSDPILQENDIFTTTIILNNQATPHDTPHDTPHADKKDLVIEFCKEEKSLQEIMAYLKLNDRKHFKSAVLNPLIQKNLIALTIPNKPRSPKQKYITLENK